MIVHLKSHIALTYFESGDWASYQKDIFDRELKQPFQTISENFYVKNC